MRVLSAGHSLGEIGGVQRYERDLASWLLACGHSPVVYATELGDAARQLDALTIPVVDDLTVTAPVDVIHGDSAVETMAALLHFSTTPAVFVCHGWEDIGRTTPRFPRILRYVAVDDTCADRLLTRAGIAPERISVLRSRGARWSTATSRTSSRSCRRSARPAAARPSSSTSSAPPPAPPSPTRSRSSAATTCASLDDLHESLFSTYEAVIEEHAATTADPAAESRAAAAFLHDLAVGDRHRERSLWTLAKASQRVLRMPVVGPAATWALRRLIRR
jgi:hypothetical protein